MSAKSQIEDKLLIQGDLIKFEESIPLFNILKNKTYIVQELELTFNQYNNNEREYYYKFRKTPTMSFYFYYSKTFNDYFIPVFKLKVISLKNKKNLLIEKCESLWVH